MSGDEAETVIEITGVRGSMSDIERFFDEGIGHISFEEKELWGQGKIGNITLYSHTARPDPTTKRRWEIRNSDHFEHFPLPDGMVTVIQTVRGWLRLRFHPRSSASEEKLVQTAQIIERELKEAGFIEQHELVASSDDVTPPHDMAKIRDLITKSFNDDELTGFLHDYFPTVYENYENENKRQKITHLLDYCKRHGKITQLLELMKENNPYQYSQYEATLSQDT